MQREVTNKLILTEGQVRLEWESGEEEAKVMFDKGTNFPTTVYIRAKQVQDLRAVLKEAMAWKGYSG
jgi:hypothetical protein